MLVNLDVGYLEISDNICCSMCTADILFIEYVQCSCEGDNPAKSRDLADC